MVPQSDHHSTAVLTDPILVKLVSTGDLMGLVLLMALTLLLFGGGGYYGHRSGYYPGTGNRGGVTLVLTILVLTVLLVGGYHR